MFQKVLIISSAALLFSCSSHYHKTTALPAEQCSTASSADTHEIVQALGLTTEALQAKTGVLSLEDGGKSLVTRAWLCDHAKRTIDIQYYIFSKDNTGLIACDFLVRAADRGVKVRLIIDDATVRMASGKIYALDSHPNIEIKIYNPGLKVGTLGSRLRRLIAHPRRINRRMHNKTLTIDDQATIIGGRNIADEYFDYDRHYNFRDRDVLLFGRSVADVKNSFEEYWNDERAVPYIDLVRTNKRKAKDPHRFDKLHQYACDENNFSQQMREKIKSYPDEFRALQTSGEFQWVAGVSFVADVPGKNEDRETRKGGRCLDSLLPLISKAKKTVDIQSPYLILTDKGKALFADLVKRGVKVRVLTNSLAATDNHEAFSGYQRDRKEILETGIEVYEFKPHPAVRYKIMTPEVQAAISYTPVFGLHSKTMIIDEEITVIGSFNLDPRSANLNSEVIAIIRSRDITKTAKKYLEEEFLPENAWRITPDFNPDAEAGNYKRAKAASRKIFPKGVL